MFSTFDVLEESSLHNKAAQEFITVGWGKKETQFHGSAGKAARKKEDIEVADVEQLDKTITCCWRGDGEFFAVNHVGANGRMFKVYSKDGVLTYTSEICLNLQVPIAWKPSGLWVCKPEIHPNKYSITLFEVNGLKHNELVLPFRADEEEVIDLSWSQDSDVFLVETRKESRHRLYFYTICNYHWYLKHSMTFDGKIVYNWSQNYAEPKQLSVITSQSEHLTLKFDWVVNSSSGASDTDESIVAVIDGRKLLLTNFKSQMVPPPMASFEVPLDTAVNVVDFLKQPGGDFDSNSFFTVDFNNTVSFYRSEFVKFMNGRRLTGAELVKRFTVGSIAHALWMSVESILIASGSTIQLCSIDTGTVVSEICLEGDIGSVNMLTACTAIAQLVDGTLVALDVNDNEISVSDLELEKLPEFCERFEVTTSNDKPAVYALKQNKKKLYLNSKELATEVTSFVITDDNDFLIYTTIGELKFVGESSQVVDTRRIERGSRIISLVKDKSQVIFQLPRGNLETISPRILSLKIIKRLLKANQYRLALDLLRKERINLNLLIDLNPQKFLRDLAVFIEQVDNISWLNLFLTELKNEDVTVTMYKFCGSIDVDQEVFDKAYTVDNKIHHVSNKMLEIFQATNRTKYLLPSLTCHVKNQQLETALQMIWDLKKSGVADKEADDAVKYFLYLIDINVLYNIALGMYDFQLVLFVAQKSQKDPKEYIPFLNELNKLDKSYAKFKIDCHLKRYGKAIKHIAALCDDEAKFDEAIEVTKKHELYEDALASFAGDEKCYRRICVLFGDHLRVKGKLLDASLLYERGGEFQQALSGARNTLDWQRCLVLGKKCGFGEDEMKDLAVKLTSSLRESGRFKEASELFRRFQSDDLATLVEILAQGRMFSEAILQVTLSGQDELIEASIKPQLKLQVASAIEFINDQRQQYLEQKDRLLSVRQEKLRKIQSPQDFDDEAFSDTTSLMSSQNSRTTTRTFKTSKTRRKHEKKLLNMKEGNKFEDIALVDSIWKLVHSIIAHDYQHMVKELLKNAVELKLDDEARTLQKAFKELLLLLKHTVKEIWIKEMLEAGRYPETEEEMMQHTMDSATGNKMAYELISKLKL